MLKHLKFLLEAIRTVDVPPKTLDKIVGWVLKVRDEIEAGGLIGDENILTKSKAIKTFKVDFSGWRYDKNVKGVDYRDEKNLDIYKRYNKIKVIVRFSNESGDAQGFFLSEGVSITLRFGEDVERWLVRTIVEHEMIHYVEFFLRALLPGNFGSPKKGISTPDISQTRGVTGKAHASIEQEAWHSLDDIEFESQIATEMRVFEEIVGSFPKSSHIPTQHKNETELFKYFVYQTYDEPKYYKMFYPKSYVPASKFFLDLKKHSMPKWREAVKKASKALE